MTPAPSVLAARRVSRALHGALLAVAMALSALVIANTLPYLAGGLDHAFLAEKGPLAREPLWRTAFYLHVSGGMACLVAGPLLLWPGLPRRRLAWHRALGRAYVLAILVWAAPSGLVLALHAKGGAWGRAGFLVLAVAWYLTTAMGFAAVHRRRMDAHVRWMIRSYGLTTSALTFRVFQLLFAAAGVGDEPNYIASLWLSLGASVVIAETAIQLRSLPASGRAAFS